MIMVLRGATIQPYCVLPFEILLYYCTIFIINISYSVRSTSYEMQNMHGLSIQDLGGNLLFYLSNLLKWLGGTKAYSLYKAASLSNKHNLSCMHDCNLWAHIRYLQWRWWRRAIQLQIYHCGHSGGYTRITWCTLTCIVIADAAHSFHSCMWHLNYCWVTQVHAGHTCIDQVFKVPLLQYKFSPFWKSYYEKPVTP